LQFALHVIPDFGCRHEITSRCSLLTGSNCGLKAGLFRQVAIHGFTREVIHLSACLSGHLRELSFLIDSELHFHALRLGEFWIAVNPDCQRCCLPFLGLAQLGDHGEVFEGGDVALDLAMGGQLPQQTAHNLAAAGLGQGLGEADIVWAGQRANFL